MINYWLDIDRIDHNDKESWDFTPNKVNSEANWLKDRHDAIFISWKWMCVVTDVFENNISKLTISVLRGQWIILWLVTLINLKPGQKKN